MEQNDFIRYLLSKKSVDDRALNLRVWNKLKETLRKKGASKSPLRALEIGAGIGTMLTRMLDDDLLPDCAYCLLDINEGNIQAAPGYLASWAATKHIAFEKHGENFYSISTPSAKINLEIFFADIFDFITEQNTKWDVLIGHAVLDLFDLSSAIPAMKAALNPEGIMYFSINYDGHTIFEPQINPLFEENLLYLYNQSMDERLKDGNPSGDSQAGRHLFSHLKDQGIEILAAGSSDWVVFPGSGEYLHQEAEFLHHLIDTIYNEMKDHPKINQAELGHWTTERKNQIDNGDLVCIVHQLDFLGRVNI